METVNGDYITDKDVKLILNDYGYLKEGQHVENYTVQNASNNMLGFLADYWRLRVVIANDEETKLLSFFVKAISRSNAAKAKMVNDLKLFEKENAFYAIIKRRVELPDLMPWSPKLVTTLDGAMVFEDLNALQYKIRNKYERFDTAHTLQALQTLARFHASSIIFEEKRSKELQRRYRINDEYERFLNEGGYKMSDPWFIQCMKGALEAIRTFSKYSKSKQIMDLIDSRWHNIWASALDLNNVPSKNCSVICHRDLWNNNIMFHYKKNENNTSYEPDNCLLVDFQAVKYQAPASDVILLLYCNLDPNFREHNMEAFLNFYYQHLESILFTHGVAIDDVMTNEEFLVSAKEQRLFGLIGCACLIPQFWLNDEQITHIFSDSAQFNEILSFDKSSFIKKMMKENQDYKENVMKIFEEIVEKYCLSGCE